MKDWFHAILEHLYKTHPLDDTQVSINNFLLSELKIAETDIKQAAQLRDVLQYLSKKNFIDWGDEKLLDGAELFGAPHHLENHKNIETSTLKYHKVWAKLTLDGYNYFTEHTRLKEQHESIITTNASVRGTNTKTWIIAGVAALFAMLTFFKSCAEDQQSRHKQLQPPPWFVSHEPLFKVHYIYIYLLDETNGTAKISYGSRQAVFLDSNYK